MDTIYCTPSFARLIGARPTGDPGKPGIFETSSRGLVPAPKAVESPASNEPRGWKTVVANLDDVGNDDADRQDERVAILRSARRRERARYCAIMSSSVAGRHPALAAHIAVLTSMPRTEAIAFIQATAAAATPSQGSSDSLAEQIVVAGKKRRGEVPTTSAASASQPGEARSMTAAEIILAGKKRRGET